MTARLNTVRTWHRPLMVNAALMFGLVLFAGVGLVVDNRTLLGESVWLKPLKFGVAFGIYGITLAWLLTRLRKGARLGWWLGTLFAMSGVLDVAVITFAAARGTFSHFNVSDDPLDRLVQTVFMYAVPPILITILVVTVLVLIQRTGDRALSRALRAGLGLTIGGIIAAVVLSGRSGSEPRTVSDANGGHATLLGSHGIGNPDGNGMPITDWSTTGGDLRVPHFVGLHGIHALLLVVAILNLLAARYHWLRDEKVRARLVAVAALGYTGLLWTLGWQAWRGQSLIHPDGHTLIAFAAIAVFTVVGAGGVVLSARRRTAPPAAVLERPRVLSATLR